MRIHLHRVLSTLLISIFLLSLPTIGIGQETEDELQLFEKRLEELNIPIADSARKQVLARIASNISKIRQLQEQAANLSGEFANPEQASIDLTAELEKLRNAKADESAEYQELSTSELENEQNRIRREIEDLNTKIGDIELTRKQNAESKDGIQDSIGQNKQRINELQSQTDVPPSLQIAQDVWQLDKETEILWLNQSNSLLELKLQTIALDEKYNLSSKQSELLALQLSRLRDADTRLTQRISANRQEVAAEQARDASKNAAAITDDYPWLASSEGVNVELANSIRDIARELTDDELLRSQLQRQVEELERNFQFTQTRIVELGRFASRSTSVGAILRKLKGELPNHQQQIQGATDARQIIEDLQFQLLEIDTRLSELSADVIRNEVEAAGIESSEQLVDENQEPVEALLLRRRKYLEDYRQKIDARFQAQWDIEKADLDIAKIVQRFNGYINERILWIRSNKLLFSQMELDAKDRELVRAKYWSDTVPRALSRVRSAPFYFGVLLTVITGLLIFQRRLRRRVDELGEIAKRGSCTTFWPTAWSSVLSTMIAMTIPVLLVGVGWGLSRDIPSGRPLYDGLAQSLLTAGLFAMPFAILRRICRPEGLAICHFDWPESSVSKLQQELTWFISPATLGVFLISLFVTVDSVHRVDLIERIIFVAAMALTAYFLFRVLSPTFGIFSAYLKWNQSSWANQMSYIWLTGVLLLPLTLAVLAIVGYYYTALNLTRCLVITFALALGVELARALVRRFVLVRRRHAHIEKARRQREIEIAAEKEAARKATEERKRRLEAGEAIDESTTPIMSSESLADLQADIVDIDQNAGQANQLIRLLATGAWILGMWLIWSDVLPALRALDEYKLWKTNTSSIADSDATLTNNPAILSVPTESDNKTESQPIDENTGANAKQVAPRASALSLTDDDSVSLRDIIIFLAIALVTFFAARNLPNAFEMLFLNELPVDRSARFATKALFSYAIIVIGGVLCLSTLSIQWSSIQWLVTALTFGLAFGLQEIFANFVAGIILMFERPMRIGDLITVDDFTGVVTRIRTRATTIVNWDRKEYVIPNKDFITGRLINWTLSDEINRIQFTVGIAYGSDVNQAKRIIFDICKDHDSVVSDPPTSITFEEFADSSLNLVVRTFLGEVDRRLVVIDDLHTRINEAFNEAGIEIAFPQRDLHVKNATDFKLQE